MAESWAAGEPVESDRSGTFADGLAVRVAIPLAVRVLGEVASGFVTVSEREIAEAVGALHRAGIRVEGAAAAGVAALPKLEPYDGPVVVVDHGPQHRRRASPARRRAARVLSGLTRPAAGRTP